MTPDNPRRAEVRVTGWHATTWKEVEVIGETRTRYRIRAIKLTALPRKVLMPGETALVPKRALNFPKEPPR